MINTKKGNRLNLKTPSQIYHNRKREKELPYLVSSLPDCLCLNMSHDSVLTMTANFVWYDHDRFSPSHSPLAPEFRYASFKSTCTRRKWPRILGRFHLYVQASDEYLRASGIHTIITFILYIYIYITSFFCFNYVFFFTSIVNSSGF